MATNPFSTNPLLLANNTAHAMFTSGMGGPVASALAYSTAQAAARAKPKPKVKISSSAAAKAKADAKKKADAAAKALAAEKARAAALAAKLKAREEWFNKIRSRQGRDASVGKGYGFLKAD